MDYVEEFELDGNVTMDDIKQRVKTWENSYDGSGYVRMVKSERDIALLKSIHDKKVCCYPCIIAVISAFFLPFLLLSMPLNFAGMMMVLFGYIAFIMVVAIISYGYFFLGTKKAEYHLTFSHETPIRVRIRRNGGALGEFAHEYESLKKMVIGQTKDSGPFL